MSTTITCTLWQFETRLLEWVRQETIRHFRAEVFSLYAQGYGAREVGEYLVEKTRTKRKFHP